MNKKYTYANIPIILDKERMDKALRADRVQLPKGLDRTQIHHFLLEQAKNLNKNQ